MDEYNKIRMSHISTYLLHDTFPTTDDGPCDNASEHSLNSIPFSLFFNKRTSSMYIKHQIKGQP